MYRLVDVPDRDGILIHPANTSDELRGCIALGQATILFDSNHMWGLTNSMGTIARINQAFLDEAGQPESFDLDILAHDLTDAVSDGVFDLLGALESKLRRYGGERCSELYSMGPMA